YGTDTGTATGAGGTSLSSTTGVHQQFTGAITAQATDTFTTFNDTGNNNVTLASGAVLVVNGFMKSGGGAAVLKRGKEIRASNNADLIIRTLSAGDSVTINTQVAALGGNALGLSGPGSLTLAGTNNYYTGATTVNGGGTLTLSGTYFGGGAFTVRSGGTLN